MVEIVVGHPLDEAGPRTELVGQRLTLASLDRRGGPRKLHVRRVDDARHRRRDPSAVASACGCRYGLGAGRSDRSTTRAPSPEGGPRLSQSNPEAVALRTSTLALQSRIGLLWDLYGTEGQRFESSRVRYLIQQLVCDSGRSWPILATFLATSGRRARASRRASPDLPDARVPQIAGHRGGLS